MTCSVNGCPGDSEWDFKDVRLCQDHWEEYCSVTWWEMLEGKSKESELEAFVEARSSS